MKANIYLFLLAMETRAAGVLYYSNSSCLQAQSQHVTQTTWLHTQEEKLTTRFPAEGHPAGEVEDMAFSLELETLLPCPHDEKLVNSLCKRFQAQMVFGGMEILDGAPHSASSSPSRVFSVPPTVL